jgi:hypothetical protein
MYVTSTLVHWHTAKEGVQQAMAKIVSGINCPATASANTISQTAARCQLQYVSNDRMSTPTVIHWHKQNQVMRAWQAGLLRLPLGTVVTSCASCEVANPG